MAIDDFSEILGSGRPSIRLEFKLVMSDARQNVLFSGNFSVLSPGTMASITLGPFSVSFWDRGATATRRLLCVVEPKNRYYGRP